MKGRKYPLLSLSRRSRIPGPGEQGKVLGSCTTESNAARASNKHLARIQELLFFFGFFFLSILVFSSLEENMEGDGRLNTMFLCDFENEKVA